MATTSPDNISYPTNADAQKTLEQRIQDTATSVQTALNTRASLSGATFTGTVSSSGKIVGTTQPDAGSDGGVAVKAPASGSQTSAYLQFVNNAYTAQWGTIQATSISEMNLNASYVKTPSQPSFQGQGSGGQINSNNVSIVFDNQGVSGAHNTGGHYNTSTGVFTAPVAGRYQVSFYMLTNAPNMGNSSVQIMLRYNGVDKYFVCHNHNSSWVVEGMTQIFNMAANDYISFYMYRGSGHYGAYSSLSIRLVG